eukprot:1516713-Pyramimonas_sp.AAC.1
MAAEACAFTFWIVSPWGPTPPKSSSAAQTRLQMHPQAEVALVAPASPLAVKPFVTYVASKAA